MSGDAIAMGTPTPAGTSTYGWLAALTTEEARVAAMQTPSVVLVPVGSVEPHGPHLPLATDAIISEEACARAATALAARGIAAFVAPTVPYGVTEFARGFAGAIGVPAGVLQGFLRAIVDRFLADGWSHVSLVNNHLEPAHDAAVRAAIAGLAPGMASVACPLTRRWARTLSDEFKRGDCHAGRYETSLVMAARGEGSVRAEGRGLPAVGVSLSEGIRGGKTSFVEMGMGRAYTGAPAEASAAEGEGLMGKLVGMVVGEVVEGLGARGLLSME